jgi:ABC-type transport system substrate-binding protein
MKLVRLLIILFLLLIISYKHKELYLILKQSLFFEKPLVLSFPSKWDNLIPSKVNTLAGNYILKSNFESLVEYDSKGFISPALSKSWFIENEFMVYTFIVDTNRQFSDGSYLTAEDVKTSWEMGLRENIKSAGSGLMDGFNLIMGIENFKKTGKLSGIKVIGNNKVSVQFSKKYRSAMDRFAGLRMSIFKVVNGNYIGTGPYIIEKNLDSELLLIKNKYYHQTAKGFQSIRVKYIPPPLDIIALKNGEVDAAYGHSFLRVKACDEEQSNIECYYTAGLSHLVVPLNRLKSKIFSDPNLRRAVNYLIQNEVKQDITFKNYFTKSLELDSQVFLPIQPGRIHETEVNNFLKNGERYLPLLRKASIKNPITFYTRFKNNYISQILERNGVKVKEVEESKETNWIKLYYSTFEIDMMILSLSVTSSDPDGLYHILGSSGAISSKMTFREKVGSLLESGRNIADISKLDNHYKKVTMAYYEEVPFVHLGYTHEFFVIRKDRIKIDSNSINLHLVNFNQFEKRLNL